MWVLLGYINLKCGKSVNEVKRSWWGKEQVSTVSTWLHVFLSNPCSQLSYHQHLMLLLLAKILWHRDPFLSSDCKQQQQVNKQTPVSMQRLRYCWTITMETVSSMWFMPRCYKQDSLKQWVSCQQFSWVKWHEVAGWWVREFSCQFSWSQPVKKRLGGWCEMATSLGPS
jgi:hypothetical protein